MWCGLANQHFVECQLKAADVIPTKDRAIESSSFAASFGSLLTGVFPGHCLASFQDL